MPLRPESLFPLDHQQVSQTRVDKGISCDRHDALPSPLPSEAATFYWRVRWSDSRGDDSGDTIINHLIRIQETASLVPSPVFNPFADAGFDSFSMAAATAHRLEQC